MRVDGISKLQLARRVLQTRFRWKHPVYLIHSLTARCNARCGFCAWNPDFYDPKDELKTDEVKKLYLDARNAGFLALSIWGGEPLVHKDVGELLQYAKHLGLATHMVTNGALLERKMDEVMPHLDRVCLSVDHPSEKHDKMRGVKGLYGKILSATVKIKSKYPTKKIVWIYTIQNDNVDLQTVEEMAEIMKTLGVAGVFNGMRLEAASETPDDVDLAKYSPSDSKLAQAFGKVRDLKKRGYPIVNSFTHIEKMMHLPMHYRCHWPKIMLPIEANGDVVDCMHWGRRPITNVRETAFEDILKHPRVLALAGKEGEKCHKCVSLHRIDVSESWEGRVRPLVSWVRNVV